MNTLKGFASTVTFYNPRFVLLFCLFTLASSLSFADENSFAEINIPHLPADTDEKPPHSSTLAWLIDTRNYWGKVVGDTGAQLDGFFAGDDAIRKSNGSFLKLGFEFQQTKGGTSYFDPKVKFRLDLPTLKEKLRIVLESEPPEEQTIGEQKRPQGSNKDQKNLNDSAVGALDFELNKKRHINTSTGVGVKFGQPIDPFWRYRLNAKYAINKDWELSSYDSLYYFHSEGWGTQLNVTAQRNSPWFVFRQTSDGRYDHKTRRWELANTLSFLREIDSKRAINYQIGILGETQPEVQATGYFAHAIYRRKMHKEWLFYEMIPEIYYPKEDNWKFSPSITFKIEMVLSSEQQ
ncbi:hypothetical protein A3765_04490 [Oleiphilus sp. HI0130]|nr:hypothetical protein A3765_04490 [Oleiphilus sp. HI0130]